jgi:signal-transduction protein with cAMP-binding, CBS, and nucleotidyltransferase domain
MRIGKFCKGNAVVAAASMNVLNAAKLMRDCGARAVIVVADDNRTSPLGVVSLETLVWEVMAGEGNPAKIHLRDVMRDQFLSVKESDSLFNAIRLMFDRGVGSVVIVDEEGRLSGLVTMEELFGELMMELLELSTLAEPTASAAGRERTYWPRRIQPSVRDAIGASKEHRISTVKEGAEEGPLALHS